MTEIKTDEIIEMVSALCIKANCCLNADIKEALSLALLKEESETGREVINTLLENAKIAGEEELPMCQDTGMTVIFVEAGMDIHIRGGDLEEAINEGVRQGYKKGFLRNSIVRDPIDRINTNDNTPAIIHYSIVRGEELKITVAPKGFGSENMGKLTMLTPSAGIEGIKSFVIDTVSSAGANPCPPIIVGVGIGGTMEKCALLAKQALLRSVGTSNKDPYWDGIEKELLEKINNLGIGPAGFGGRITALGVHIERYATHIAGLPVAVNIGCHATRHSEGILPGYRTEQLA